MEIDPLRFFVFVIVLVASVMFAIKLELLWYVGFFFVLGTTQFFTLLVKAMQNTWWNK